MEDAGGEEAAAGRHSWFLTEEAHRPGPAACCCLPLSTWATWLLGLPGGCSPAKHKQHTCTQTVTFRRTSPLSCKQAGQEVGSDESTAPQLEPQDELTCYWHSLTCALDWLTHTGLEKAGHKTRRPGQQEISKKRRFSLEMFTWRRRLERRPRPLAALLHLCWPLVWCRAVSTREAKMRKL